jgi:prolyl-tRNA editing enzyme YbaK/EbsC (Cys-tRNA(Pro) deacylase)
MAIDAAYERGVHLEQIIKTMLLKGESSFFIVLLPGQKKLSWKKIRAAVGFEKKSIRLASSEEIVVGNSMAALVMAKSEKQFRLPSKTVSMAGEVTHV